MAHSRRAASQPWLWLLTLAVLIQALWALTDPPTATRAADDRPNILLIVSDDQRYDTMEFMPRTRALIFERGVEFTRAYVTTPRCCPSRASILTGQYAHNHNVRVNEDRLRQPTVVETLHESGYRTALVGKYLNSYPLPDDDAPLPEFDLWAAMADGLTLYFNTPLNVNGQWVEHEGYQTDILLDYALRFMQEAAADDQPFFVLFAPYTPHVPAIPAPGDENLYADLEPYAPPNLNPADMSGKPEWMQALPRLTDEQLDTIQAQRLDQLRSLAALDRSVAALIWELERLGELDRTLIIYLSDNGFFWGEHRLETGKSQPYEEAVHVPLAISYPPLIGEARTDEHLVANIDLAPTLLDAAGLPIPARMDGRSLLPLLQDLESADWRDHLLLEGWPVDLDRLGTLPNFLAIHTGSLVYIETEGDAAELYDLTVDPYQLVNQIDNPAYAAERDELRAILKAESKGVNPPPLTSGANRVNHAVTTALEPVVKWLTGFWYTYRYSKKLWGSVGLAILLGIGFWKRRQLWSWARAWRDRRG